MTTNEYQEKVLRTSNSNFGKMTRLVNGAMGLCGEAGETINIVKEYVHHGKELDTEHIIDELGNAMWYIASISNALGYTLEDVMNMNIKKLSKNNQMPSQKVSRNKMYK